MKIRTLCRGLALLAVMSAGFAHAQDYSLNDALSGETIPLVFKPVNIPADFKAVKILQSGSNQIVTLNMATTEATTMGMPAEMFADLLPISWTNGQVINVAGQPFLVTYGIDLGANTMRAMTNSKKLQPFSLRLKLIKTSEISSITPMPEWTKAKYMRAMAQVVVETPTRLATNTPALPTATRPMVPAATVPTNEPQPVAINPVQTTTQNEVSSNANPTPTANTTEQVRQTSVAVKGVAVERPIDAALYQQAEDNAKSIASAMLVYAQDYDGTFPYVQSSRGAAYVLYPYVKGTDVYLTLNPVRGGEFRFNMSLAGVKMTDIMDPTNTPLFYDPFAWPNSTYLVAFADSHVKFLSPDQWEIVKKNLALKLKRNGKPLAADLGLPATAGTPANQPAPTPAPTTDGTTSPPTPSDKPAGGN